MTSSFSQPAEMSERHLLARVGSAVVALRVAQVRSVHRQVAVHAVAGASPNLLGLAEIEGEAVAVLDLCAMLELEGGRGGGSSVVIVVRQDVTDDRIGLMVDRALDLVRVPVESVEEGTGGLAAGATRLEGRTVQVLDLSALAPPDR